ncbi:hypothetical protein, partial [Pseudomonas sp. Sample_9]|uniref:hypothetical protein n=1 Tax=Pseudomonas sp. Sample_9 TaxID=2382158 RepID=UPI0019D59728
LKSPARKGVPVRFRLRAPSFNKGLLAKAKQAFVRLRFEIFLVLPRRWLGQGAKSGTTSAPPMPK